MAEIRFIHHLLALQELDVQAAALRGSSTSKTTPTWLRELAAERARLLELIPRRQQALYERVRADPALFPWVVVSRTGTCTACHAAPGPRRANGSGPPRLRPCGSCGRIIVIAEPKRRARAGAP